MIIPLLQFPNGGKVEMYSTVNRAASDFQNVFECCRLFAEMGDHAIITPQLDETIGNHVYEEIYASLRGTQYWGKCPDFNVNGFWYEHEGFSTNKDLNDPKKRKLTYSNMLNRGIKQSERIVLEDCHIGRYYAKRAIFKRIHFEKQKITEIYIRTSTCLELLYRKKED